MIISRSRVESMSGAFSPEEIAEILGISLNEVADLLEEVGAPQSRVTLRCNRTGRFWHLRSWRAAYFQVCLNGLTDWAWYVGHLQLDEDGYAILG